MSDIQGFDRVLLWSDFRHVKSPPRGDDSDAYTDSGFEPVMQGKKVTFQTVFYSSTSWVVTGKENESLRKHENGHYKISAIATRQLQQLVDELDVSDRKYKKYADDLRKKILAKLLEVQKKYDDETDHSTNSSAQSRWNEAINRVKLDETGVLESL